MNASLHDYLQNVLRLEHVQSVLFLDNRDKWGSSIHGRDLLYIVITNFPQPQWEIKQLLHDERFIEEHMISIRQLEEWIEHGTYSSILQWLVEAEVVYQRNELVQPLLKKVSRTFSRLQKWQLCQEYSFFLRHYLSAKSLLKQDSIADAYQAVIAALHHWARIIIKEAGIVTDECSWKQVKQVEPSVYKLYEELVSGQEPIEKRIELQLLPIELSVMSKMKECTQVLVELLQSQHRPWFLEELRNHPELSGTQIDLQLLLRKMADRSLIKEVRLKHGEQDVVEIGYVAAG